MTKQAQSELQRHFKEAALLVAQRQYGAAHSRIHILVRDAAGRELRGLEAQIRDLVEGLPVKRKQELLDALNARLAVGVSSSVSIISLDLPTLRAGWVQRLDRLRDIHIFQWTSHYKEEILSILETVCEVPADGDELGNVSNVVALEFTRHAKEIYQRGFEHVTQRLGLSIDDAVQKSTGGLQGFLAVVGKAYSELALRVETTAHATALRQVSSAMLLGILSGYGETMLGHAGGWTYLSRFPRSWLGSFGLLTSNHAEQIHGALKGLDRGLHNGFVATLIPVLSGIDHLMSLASPDAPCLPLLSEYLHRPPRLDLSLRLPHWAERKRFLDIQCYLGGVPIDLRLVKDALELDIDLLAAPLGEEADRWLREQHPPRNAVLDTTPVAPQPGEHHAWVTERVRSILRDAFFDRSAEGRRRTHSLRNYAKDFPLENPVRKRIYRSEERRVGKLLEMFEREVGVRLWCSIRRSGKTTACRELAAMSGTAIVVNQTMMQEVLEPDLNNFQHRVIAALDQHEQISPDFFFSTVRDSAVALGHLPTDSTKYIFVLDEYELLFGRLRAAVARDEYLEYSVGHPLLNQMASFSQDHLLVLLGQKPDA